MAKISAKERKALEKMWKGSKPSGGSNIDAPDAKYQFKIGKKTEFKVTAAGKPRMQVEYEIVGGDEDYIGTKGIIGENLESEQNMGYFKGKLQRLKIEFPGFEEVVDGSLAKEMIGCTFEGLLVTKNDFQNIYINRLIELDDEDDEEDDEETEEETDEEEEDEESDEDEDEDEDDEDEEDEDEDEEDEEDEDEDDEDEDEDEESDDEDDDEDEDEGDDDELEWPSSTAQVQKMTEDGAKDVLAILGAKVPKKSKAKGLLSDIVKAESGVKVSDERLLTLCKVLKIKVRAGTTNKTMVKKIVEFLKSELG